MVGLKDGVAVCAMSKKNSPSTAVAAWSCALRPEASCTSAPRYYRSYGVQLMKRDDVEERKERKNASMINK